MKSRQPAVRKVRKDQYNGREMNSASAGPTPASSPSPPRQRPGPGAVLTLVNGVLAGVGGAYVATRSVLITVIAAAAAIVLTAMLLTSRN